MIDRDEPVSWWRETFARGQPQGTTLDGWPWPAQAVVQVAVLAGFFAALFAFCELADWVQRVAGGGG